MSESHNVSSGDGTVSWKTKCLLLCHTRHCEQHSGKTMSQQSATKLAGSWDVELEDRVPEGRHPSSGQAGTWGSYFRLEGIKVGA